MNVTGPQEFFLLERCSSVELGRQLMSYKDLMAAGLCALAFSGGIAHATAPSESVPMTQGWHRWSALQGELILVVGSYQDTTNFHRSYTFYFKDNKDETWNQVPVRNKTGRLQFEWDSASGAEITLADGVISHRDHAVYFVVADRRADQGYQARADTTVTWYKLIESGEDMPDDPAYQFKPIFTRTYPQSAAAVETILGRELSLQPHK